MVYSERPNVVIARSPALRGTTWQSQGRDGWDVVEN